MTNLIKNNSNNAVDARKPPDFGGGSARRSYQDLRAYQTGVPQNQRSANNGVILEDVEQNVRKLHEGIGRSKKNIFSNFFSTKSPKPYKKHDETAKSRQGQIIPEDPYEDTSSYQRIEVNQRKDRPGNSTWHRSLPYSGSNVKPRNSLHRGLLQSREEDIYSAEENINAGIIGHSSLNMRGNDHRPIPRSKVTRDIPAVQSMGTTPQSCESGRAKEKKAPYRPTNEHLMMSEEHGSSSRILRPSKGSSSCFNNSRGESGNTAPFAMNSNYARIDSSYEKDFIQSVPPSFPSRGLDGKSKKTATYDIPAAEEMGPPISNRPDAIERERKWHNGRKFA